MELELTQKAATTRTHEGASRVCDCAESIPRLSLNLAAQIGTPNPNSPSASAKEAPQVLLLLLVPLFFKTAKGRLA